jgi:hypothetical protein
MLFISILPGSRADDAGGHDIARLAVREALDRFLPLKL